MLQRRLLLPVFSRHLGPGDMRTCICCHTTSSTWIPRSEPPIPELDHWGDHCLRCRPAISSQRTKLWHDRIVSVLLFLARRVGARVLIEPSRSVPDSSKRPDLIITSPDDSYEIIVDVRTCLVSSPSEVKKASQIPGASADAGATEKIRAWAPAASTAGFAFVPFCVEEGGRFGDPCLRLIDFLSLFLNSSESDRSAFRAFALQRLHLANQRGVAKVIHELQPALRGPHIFPSPTYYDLPPPPPYPRPQIHPTFVSTTPTPSPRNSLPALNNAVPS